MVTGSKEIVPELVSYLSRCHADSLPLLLKGDELIRGRLPVGAVLQSLGLFYKSFLALGILLVARFHLLKELSFTGKEVVACGTEALKDFHIHLLGCKADGFPLGLNIYNLLGMCLPVGGFRVCFLGYSLHLLAESRLLSKVLLLDRKSVV